MGTEETNAGRWTLCDLPFVGRLVLSVFLISVGLGYFSALVQLHFQQAAAGELLPGPEQVQHAYAGQAGVGQLERLITADEKLRFTATGQMSAAFTYKALGWRSTYRDYAEKKKISEAEAQKEIREVRELERQAILAWIHAGHQEDNFEGFALPEKLSKQIPAEPDDLFWARTNQNFWEKNDKGEWSANVKRIITVRCARCHSPDEGGVAGQIHLTDYKQVMDYIQPTPDIEMRGGMSLTKLAQTTHVHLLGFSMLYGLTGLIFALTSYPGLMRFIIAPLALVAQVFEISCWWLSRWDPIFAYGIMLLGGIVALTLGLQIVLSLLSLYDRKGKVIVMGLLVAAAVGFGILQVTVIGPQLEREKPGTAHAAG